MTRSVYRQDLVLSLGERPVVADALELTRSPKR